jgi:hypothetical protein
VGGLGKCGSGEGVGSRCASEHLFTVSEGERWLGASRVVERKNLVVSVAVEPNFRHLTVYRK